MNLFKKILMYVTLILSLVAILVCSLVLPDEGKTVGYRLETASNSEVGKFPKIVEVIENGYDNYFYFTDLTMEQGLEVVIRLNQELKTQK